MWRLCDPGRSCAKALAKLGNEVTEWSYREIDFKLGEQESNRLLAKQFRKEKFDLFFVSKGETIQPKVAKFARKRGVTNVLWSSDDPYAIETTVKLAPFFDHIFTTMLESHEAYEKIQRPKWLPLTCSDLYQPLEASEETVPISFIGSNYAPRSEFIKAVKEKFPDLKHFGSGWPDTDRLPDELAPKLINETKINLVVSQEGNAKYGVVNPRTFEILACRKFALVDSHIGITTLFKDRDHLGVYYDLSDLLRVIESWLYDPQGRQIVAEKGYYEFLAHHSPERRMQTMLKLMQL
jgi:spore maturation protein CgeB